MPQAIVDPEQLRQFAGALRNFTEELQQRSTSLGSQMVNLSQTWRDQQHHKFAAEFEDQMRQLTKFLEGARSHVPYLLRKADEIDAYLRG
jgi:uncharacterized protein YukE